MDICGVGVMGHQRCYFYALAGGTEFLELAQKAAPTFGAALWVDEFIGYGEFYVLRLTAVYLDLACDI